jgi:Secretion system C-terminal sorting domain
MIIQKVIEQEASMKKVILSFLTSLILLMFVGKVMAHVKLDYPNGGEIFVIGETVTVQWSVIIPHNQENWDLHFSPDGGQNWEEIELDLNLNQLDYEWIVPDILTGNARIRITMDNTGGDYDDTSSDFTIQETATSVDIRGSNLNTFQLQSNYPNPFNPTTIISYSIPGAAHVTLKVYDLLGNEVAELVNSFSLPGKYSYTFDGKDLTSGLYFYTLWSGKFIQTKKMLLMK